LTEEQSNSQQDIDKLGRIYWQDFFSNNGIIEPETLTAKQKDQFYNAFIRFLKVAFSKRAIPLREWTLEDIISAIRRCVSHAAEDSPVHGHSDESDEAWMAASKTGLLFAKWLVDRGTLDIATHQLAMAYYHDVLGAGASIGRDEQKEKSVINYEQLAVADVSRQIDQWTFKFVLSSSWPDQDIQKSISGHYAQVLIRTVGVRIYYDTHLKLMDWTPSALENVLTGYFISRSILAPGEYWDFAEVLIAFLAFLIDEGQMTRRHGAPLVQIVVPATKKMLALARDQRNFAMSKRIELGLIVSGFYNE
jgi:hypothetical protein